MSLVDVQELAPSIMVDMPYATPDNFTRKQVYPDNPRALLQAPAAEALAKAQEELRRQGLSLKIWDAYRPFSVQEIFWKILPDARYIAQPIRGENGELLKGSVHNRGAAIDCTIVDDEGLELEMPTAFDDFSEKAHRKNLDSSLTARENRALLELVMSKHGFVGLDMEWWHFDYQGYEEFPLSDEPIATGAEVPVLH